MMEVIGIIGQALLMPAAIAIGFWWIHKNDEDLQ